MGKIVSINPSNYQVIGEVEAASEQDVRNAVAKARAAQPKWAALSLDERRQAIVSFMKLCQESSEDLALLMSLEMGKPIQASRAQIKNGIHYFETYFDMAEKALAPEIVMENDTELHVQYREPLGVIAAISPWNFPFLNIPWQLGQALIAGNTIIYKPSEETVLFAQLVAKLIRESDLPEGVFSVLIGDGAVGELLVQQLVDAILFTGSTKTGQHIAELAAKNSTPVIKELGGSAPGIVFQDADLLTVIETIYNMRFDNSGQSCDALKRLLVHESKLNEVLTALKQVNDTRNVGDAMQQDTNIGPLVAKRQLDILQEQVQDALTKGAKVRFGGKQPENLVGAYYLPTMLTNISFDMRVWQEEVFGPVLAVVTFQHEAEAIQLANDTAYGLGAFVFTADKERYIRVAKQLQSGMVAHNNALYYHPTCPFGGYKMSGNSRTNGIAGFHTVTQLKLVSQEK